jgi:cell shape-determining protein MreC
MRKKYGIISIVLALALSGSVALFSSSPPVLAVRGGSVRLSLWAVRSVGGVVGAGQGVSGRGPCGDCDNDRIGRDVAEAKLARAEEENDRLKELLDLKRQSGESLIPADVALYNQEWDREWLIINRGTEDGVRVGDPVIDERRLLVGEVVEAAARSATVTIASNKGTSFAVVLAPSGESVLTHGLGARAFSVDLIPPDSTVAPGDMVVRKPKNNSGFSDIFIGNIVRLDERTGGAFKTGRAVLLSRPESLDHVMVVTAP